MKVDGLSKKAIQFEVQKNNINLPRALGEDGPVITTIEIDNRLKIMIEITEDTTNQQIRDIAKIALEWQKRLLDFQGAWRGGGRNEALERYSFRQEHGQSYTMLANRINAKVAGYLYEYLEYRKEVDMLYPELINKHECDIYYHVFWLGMESHSAVLSHAKALLDVIGIKDSEIDSYLQDGLRLIKKGAPPFPPGLPVTRYKMIETLRTYRKSKIHKSIQAVDQKERDEYIKKKMNGQKQAAIAKIIQKMKRQKKRIDEIGEKMIQAIEEGEV